MDHIQLYKIVMKKKWSKYDKDCSRKFLITGVINNK